MIIYKGFPKFQRRFYNQLRVQVCKFTNNKWRYFSKKCYGFFPQRTMGFVSLRGRNFNFDFIVIITGTTNIIFLKLFGRFKRSIIRWKILWNVFNVTVLIGIIRIMRKKYNISWSMWACIVRCFWRGCVSCFRLSRIKSTGRNHYTNAWK